MKKTYFKPEFTVVKLQSRTRLLVGSNSKVSSVNGNVFSSEVTAGTTEARSRGGWDDDEDF